MSASSFDQLTEMAYDANGICHRVLNRHDEPMLRFGQLEQSNRRKYLSYLLHSCCCGIGCAYVASRLDLSFFLPARVYF